MASSVVPWAIAKSTRRQMARAAFHASGTITRSDFGLLAELKKEAGSMLIGDDIAIDIEAETTLGS